MKDSLRAARGRPGSGRLLPALVACVFACGGVAASADGAAEAAPDDPSFLAPACASGACVTDPVPSGDESPQARACGPDGVVWASVEVRAPAELAPLEGCERITGDLALLGLVSTPTTALRSLKTVDGVLKVLGIATEVALDGFVSLEQVGGLQLDRLDRPHLSALSRLRRIGPADPSNPELGTLQISKCSELYSLEGLGALEQLGALTLLDNNTLTSLAGMTSLRELGALYASGNPLRNLAGISPVRELTLIGSQLVRLRELGDVPELRRLELSDNETLRTLLGAQVPAQMDEIVLRGNPELRDLAGLEPLRSVGALRITNNLRLSDVVLPQLERAGSLCVGANAALDDTSLAPLRAIADLQLDDTDPAGCQ